MVAISLIIFSSEPKVQLIKIYAVGIAIAAEETIEDQS
jgi:hypothetical protein